MKNTKMSKHALLSSIIAVLLSITMFIGTTFAWFTDSVTSGVNKIVAGNLDIEASYLDGDSWKSIQDEDSLFSTDLWEPGHTEIVYLKIANVGTLALNYKVLVTPVSENGGVNVYGQSFKLSDYLVFGTTEPAATHTTYTRDTARAAVGSTKGLTDVNSLTKTSAMVGKTGTAPVEQYMALVVYMPETVGNEANYKTGTAAPTIELGIKVVATQKTAENDSFGSDYDNGAVNDPLYAVGAYYDYYPQVSASASVVENGNTVITAEGKLNSSDTTETTLAKVTVPEGAVAENVTTLNLSVKPVAATNSNALNVIQAETANGREAVNFDIKVEGIAASNTAPITVEVFVGKGLNNVKVYHNGTFIEGATYNATTGIVAFTTTSFSDYTVAYDSAVAAIGDKTYGSLALAVNAAQSDETVKLLKDVDNGRQIYITADKDFTLDLNGHTYTKTSGNAPILNEGKVIIKDSIGSGAIISTNNVSIIAYGSGSVTTILSGKFTGQEGAVCTGKATGAEINIYDGVFTAIDNAVIAGNGTKRDGDANTINIYGGIFNGGIKTSGYVACGIYAPWKDTINVSGGIFNITGGAGIVARAGNVNVSGGEFHVTGNTVGKVGDSRVVVPCAAIVFDSEANYPAKDDNSKVTVTGGIFTSENNCISTLPSNDTGLVVVKGGKFSSDPSAYIYPGYEKKENGDWFEVVKKVYTFSCGAKTELNAKIPAGATIIKTQDALNAALTAATAGVTTLYVGEGDFKINTVDCDGKDITFIGAGFDKTNLSYGTNPSNPGGESGSNYCFEGSKVVFQDVTLIDGNGDDVNYKGFVRCAGLTFNNCVLKSRMTYLGENGVVSFNNCTFETPKYALWIYGSQTYNFSNCLFNSPTGRFLNVYSETNIEPIINVTECRFVDSSDGTDSNAVFNIKSTAKTKLTIKDSVVTGASPMYKVASDNGSIVTIDGKLVYGNPED